MKESASPTALREAVADVTIQVPGAPNALVGRMIEEAGYDAVYLSGAALSAGVLALPDVGLFTLTELAQQTAYLTRRVDIPVLVDADTGFGESVAVERTIVELEAAGAAAIQLEDQLMPKRCGHLSGKQLVDTRTMCVKLQAAAAAKSNPDLVLLARTDAAASEGVDAAIERAKAYVGAGADWIFPEALTTVEDFEKFAQAIDAPLVANMTEFGKSPLLTFAQLADLGYAVVLYPVTMLRIAMKAVSDALVTLRRDGWQAELVDQMQTRSELYELLEYDALTQRDQELLE